MQTKLSVEIIQTSIWTTGSTSKGRAQGEWEGDLQNCDYIIQERAVNCKITPFPCPLDVNLMAHIEVCIVFTNRLVYT